MSHPLSGLNSQLGSLRSYSAQKHGQKKAPAKAGAKTYRSSLWARRSRLHGSAAMGAFDFGMSFDGLGDADFSNQSIVNDFAGIGGEDDEALSGFGDSDEYLGKFSIGAGLRNIGRGVKKAARKVGYATKKVAYAAVGKKVAPAQKAVTRSYASVAAAVASPSNAISQVTSQVARLQQAASETPRNSSVPQVAAPIATSIPVSSSITYPAHSQGEVVSQGGISLNASQLEQPKTVVTASRSAIAHPLAIYANPMAAVNGFEGFFDDLKKKVIGDVKTAATKAVTTAKTNLITGVTKSITGSDVVQKAAADVAKQNAAEAAIAKTEAAAKAVVAKTEEAVKYVQENKAKVAGISTAVLAAGALGAYLMFFRKK